MQVAQRLARLRQTLDEKGLHALLITDATNRRYVSGFTGTAGVLMVAQDRALLITDFRYVEQARRQAPAFAVIQHQGGALPVAAEQVKEAGWRRVGFEDHQLTHARHGELVGLLPAGAELVPAARPVEALRLTKEPEELERIGRAQVLTEEALGRLLPQLEPGMVERDVALRLEFAMREAGAEGAAFDFIVASGPRSALPHGVAADRQLQAGELVTIDCGAVYQGYHGDMTRTVVLGDPSPRQRQVWETVLRAQEAALARLRPGLSGRQADALAREVIEEAGYGDAFGHGLGHGVGLAIHEAPRLSPRSEGQELAAGMVVSVEPGIYLEGWGGVRIEDLVVITEDGCRNLNTLPKVMDPAGVQEGEPTT